jgi:Lrp/AsnC family transcriptional regulator, leucine-responsive regulatory protein
MLDTIDYKLLEILQKNARATQIDLAAAVGLSQPSVADRLRKLEQEGFLLGYAAQVNARKLGKDITAYIGVGIEHPKFSSAFAKKILAIPEVLECHLVTGQDSYLLKVKTENTGSLNELITGKIRTIRGVTRTQTTIVLQSVKEGSYISPAAEPGQTASRKSRRARSKS